MATFQNITVKTYEKNFQKNYSNEKRNATKKDSNWNCGKL